MIIDAHAHIFTPQIIANVSGRPALIEALQLDVAGAKRRTSAAALQEESSRAGVDVCLLLPTASVDKVLEINIACREIAAGQDFLCRAGTLHPQFPANTEELSRLATEGVRAIKLCSFSQGFSVRAAATQKLFRLIEDANHLENSGFFIIIDTLYGAHRYFGTAPEFDTTPAMLMEAVKAFPGINFVLAHMGGLNAPRDEIFRHLLPANNLYLDTSGAAYTLTTEDFVALLNIQGPDHIIFGTDWPWFGHRQELDLLDGLLDRAGFIPEQKYKVYCRNAAALLGLSLPE